MALFGDIRPEDLIIRKHDGSTKLNHDLIKDYGLFNLGQQEQDEVLQVYLENATARGPKSKYQVEIFIMLSKAINAFPFPVISNFTSGRAYEHNMKLLEPYAE